MEQRVYASVRQGRQLSAVYRAENIEKGSTMARRTYLEDEEIDRILFEEEDSSDVEDVEDVVIEADRVFDSLHDALTWQEEELEEQIPHELDDDLDDEERDDLAEPTPSTSSTPSTPLSPSELRSRKRRRGPLQPAEGKELVEMPLAIYKGKDRTVWHSKPNPSMPPIIRTDQVLPGAPTTHTLLAKTCEEIFSLFLSDPMLGEVCMHTCDKIQDLRIKFKKQENPTFKDVSLMELKALLGILIMAGARKDNHLNTDEMFSVQLGCPFYRSIMSERRFNFLIRALRFDDSATREERRKKDIFTPMRKLWDSVISKCRSNYSPGPHVTVDEQLLAFRGRCSFRMFIRNKPAKYGIKLVMLCDADSAYMCNAIPYCGKKTGAPWASPWGVLHRGAG
ncbi:uncharacterized protein [Macrobrachium rosenbergii]|uniref:uncharacterized protein n=1 Tax=Macrobrachium rosenbergii TaxID=79674 RepID=UPI0034D51465